MYNRDRVTLSVDDLPSMHEAPPYIPSSAPKQERTQKQSRLSKGQRRAKFSESCFPQWELWPLWLTVEYRLGGVLSHTGWEDRIHSSSPFQGMDAQSLGPARHWLVSSEKHPVSFRKSWQCPREATPSFSLLFSSWWLWGLLRTVSAKGRL